MKQACRHCNVGFPSVTPTMNTKRISDLKLTLRPARFSSVNTVLRISDGHIHPFSSYYRGTDMPNRRGVFLHRFVSKDPTSPSGPGSSVGIVTGYGAGRSGDRIPVGAKFSAPVKTDPGAHPASCTTGTGSFPGVKSGRGVKLTPHPVLVPWSRKSRGIPLLPLWAVRPVQSLSACTRVHFTLPFYLTSPNVHHNLFSFQTFIRSFNEFLLLF